MGLLYVLGYFEQKNFFSNFFLTKSRSLFAISVGQLYTRAAVKELDFRAEAGAVGSLRAESELQLQLSFKKGATCSGHPLQSKRGIKIWYVA